MANNANAGKKKHRRLKKSVRKTLGALFLISALVVAAIPVDGLQAATTADGYEDTTSVSISEPVFYPSTNTYKIPKVVDTATIYSYPLEGKGITFRFAYVTVNGTEGNRDEPRYAIILGYEQTGNLDGGILEIPETMEAYKKYSMQGSNTGNVAVNLDNEFLYYMRTENKLDANNQPIQARDPISGELLWRDPTTQKNPIYETEDIYRPCYYSTRAQWAKESEKFYVVDTYVDDVPATYKLSTADRIAAAQVTYIGNQYLKSDDDTQEWKVAGEVTEPSKGVFYGATNITTLVLPNSITGIGKYAFANNGFATVRFGNGLRCLGDYAFYGCGSMTAVEFDVSCGVETIGAYCFAGCGALPEINLPGNVQALGDGAFSECTSLQKINMVYPDHKNDKGENAPLYGRLNQLGRSVFRNCASLKGIEFPNSFTGAVDVSQFEGCSNLEYIRSGFDDTMPTGSGSSTFTLKEGDYTKFGWKDFEDQIKNEDETDTKFYLWGPKGGALHKFATATKTNKDNNKIPIAFKFYDTDLEPHMHVYEKVVSELDADGNPINKEENQTVYWVNEQNELVRCRIGQSISNLILPESIGPKNINAIGSGTFENKCNLKMVTIPASVRTIAQNAFKGCHNLEAVIFTNAESIKAGGIGTGAFDTQGFSASHMTNCSDRNLKEHELMFVGTISNSSEPFLYAMRKPSEIGLGSVNRTYITYYSGFPTHLAVRYNEATDSNELFDYPTLSDLLNGKYTAANKYVYMTSVNETETSTAASGYAQTGSIEGLTPYQRSIINAVLHLELPEGIETIAMVKKSSGKLVEDVPGGVKVAEDSTIDLGTEDSEVVGLFSYKENTAAGQDLTDSERAETKGMRKTLVARDVRSIVPGAFRDCTALQSTTFGGALQGIGHYAFADCDNLESVSVPESVSALGRIPFTGCDKLANVNFNGSENYTCRESIIYKSDSNGNWTGLVEYLKGRRIPSLSSDELAGIAEISPEAFRGTGVTSADFSETTIKDVPEYAFKETPELYSVTLPIDCMTISKGSFMDSKIAELKIPGTVGYIDQAVFTDPNGGDDIQDGIYQSLTDLSKLVVFCPDGSLAASVVDKLGIAHKDRPDPVWCTVYFNDWDGTSLGVTKVLKGEKVEPENVPQVSERDGYIHVGWNPSIECVTEVNYPVTAQYEPIKPCVVLFKDWDDREIKKVEVALGGSVEAPVDPVREGYKFMGWSCVWPGAEGTLENVTQDMTFQALYEVSWPTVRFMDDDWVTVISEQKVEIGKDAIKPKDPEKPGYKFLGWYPDPVNITKDLDTYAKYERLDSTSYQHIVRFIDWDDTVLYIQKVNDGEDAILPQSPSREGYIFTGWRPLPQKVTKDMDSLAQYEKSGAGGTSGDGSSTQDPNGNNGGDGQNSKLYTLTVQNGSGSGSYVAGSQPIIIANDPSATQEFAYWTIDPENTAIASKVLSATVVTMPEGNVTVTAHYRAKSSNGVTGTGNSTNNYRPNGSNVSNGGTTVVIDKNGLSNTGVVSATVNGSSDNFVIRISESSAATEAALKALLAEFGNVENLKYFPMDISLYDSTGTRKITDTTGLSVSITLPLPDSLKVYAGNNRVASVVNNRLQGLTARFTTINKVPCVTFTAEHFSPYVIYVNTTNLGEGSASDNTPKTGDGIHPKWFLSIGLACLSLVMFMKKDTKKKQKVAVRAK